MREKKITERYSQYGEYRFEVFDREDGTFQVWVQTKIYDDYMGDDWFDWIDIKDYAHITDTVERALNIGNESLVNLESS